ncbi:MAG TPA: hypothetical protein EYP98_12635 [Planctomycetes bacterium]|nr:hypothetical protein [Planctomycetota bacterium]
MSYEGHAGLPSAIGLLAFGFSDTQWNGLPLPLNLQPFGTQPGCHACSDWVITLAFITNAAGYACHPVTIANDLGWSATSSTRSGTP